MKSIALALAAIYGYIEFGRAMFNNEITLREIILLLLAVVETILLIRNLEEKE